jgi:hypothetical protein
MPFFSCFSHCSQIGEVIKHVLTLITCEMPHYHVVRLEVIIIAKVKVFLIT